MSIFKKIGRSIGNIFKKVDPFESLGSVAGSGVGSLVGAGIGEAVAPEGGALSADVGGLIGGQIGSIIGGSAGKRYSESLRPIHHHHAGTAPPRPKLGDKLTHQQKLAREGSFRPTAVVLDTRDQAMKAKSKGINPLAVASKQKFISGVPTPKKILDGVPTPKRPFISGVPTPTRPPPNELEKRKAIKEKEQLFA